MGKSRIRRGIKIKKRRKENAELLAEKRANRTDEEQLSKLDKEGHKALKERARLKQKIESR